MHVVLMWHNSGGRLRFLTDENRVHSQSSRCYDLWWAKWRCIRLVSQQEQRVKEQQH